MEALLSPPRLARDIEALGAGAYLQDPVELVAEALALFRPPENISTVECAERYRYIPTPKGDGKRLWSRDLTPYNVEPMNALDEPGVTEVIMPKAARTGGTVVGENYLFKLMRYGPMGDVGWFLKSDSEVKAYADKGFRDMFDLHPEIRAKVGTGRSDNTLERKIVDGRSVELLPANPTKFTNRQFYLMVGDEIDTYQDRICASFVDQARIRGRALGTNRKVFMASHMDKGWSTGIAAAWIDTSRGIFVWPCAECGCWASPYPTKYWPEVAQTQLWYKKAEEGAGRDVCIDMARDSAALKCPHCGCLLDDEQRHEMIDLGKWLHKGQTLDLEAGICGERAEGSALGFWVHGTMSKMIALPDLARDLESARSHYRATRKVDRLREVTAKVLGEIFEGAGEAGTVDAAKLQQRRKAEEADGRGFERGSVPSEALFLTQSVDVGHGKFDLLVRGWDVEGRSWLIDRVTLRQRQWEDGAVRDLRPAERIEDWHVLDDWIDRKWPMADDPSQGLPVAITLIDAGDGNVTWKAYEYARRMSGRKWGQFSAVRVIKGNASAKAPEIPPAGTPIAKDQNGKPVHPVIRLYTLGVHRLKELELERLAAEDGGPGQWYIANGIARRHIEELFGERLIGGKWERHGDNETLDLAGYCEAGRLMLQPDRKGIKWAEPERRPPWARPVSLFEEGGDRSGSGAREARPGKAKADKPTSILERFDQTANRDEDDDYA